MIQANEIKPNNIIDTPYGIATVYGISKDCVQITLKDNESIFDFDLEDAKPIELTEDILLKCGFVKKNKKNEYFELDEWITLTEEISEEKPVSFDFRCKNTYLTCISYLHQLQNLYFALTQTELEINL